MATKVTRTNVFQNFFNSIIGIFIGILLILGSIVLLFVNEVLPNKADAARSAKQLTQENISSLDGKAVWVKGALHATAVGADEFLADQDHIYLERIVEVYVNVEHESTKETDEIGGGTKTVTTYTYTKEWSTIIPDSSNFYDKDTKYQNPATTKLVDDYTKRGANMTINGVKVTNSDVFKLSFEGATTDLTQIGAPMVLNGHRGDGAYIYKSDNQGTTQAPVIGDYRISYRYVANDTDGIVVAKLAGDTLVRLDFKGSGVIKFSSSLYRFFDVDTINEVIAQLGSENSARLWGLRLLGFILMLIGFTLLFGPLQVIAGIIPFVKKITGPIIFFFCLMISLPLSLIVILFANIINNIFALIALIALIVLLVILLIKKGQKKKLA